MLKLNRTIKGNTPTILKTFPDACIDCCITSPPYYNLRAYGTVPQIWDGDDNCDHTFENNYCLKCGAWQGELGREPEVNLYIKHLIDIFAEIKRVLKPEGTIFVNIGDSSGTGSGKGDRSKYLQRTNRGTFTEQWKNEGKPKVKGYDKCMLQIPHRFSIEMTDKLGLLLRRDIIWHKPSIMPMSYKDNFTQDYENIFFFTKNKKYYFEQQFENANYDGRKNTIRKGIKKYNNPSIRSNGSIDTFNKRETERWIEKDGVKVRNMRSVWSIPPEPIPENHYATYPQKLIERLIKAGCPENGIVLDPFIGSGTTGIVARKLNRNYIGIDLYYDDVREKRLEKELGMFG